MQHPKDQSVDQRNHLPGQYIYCLGSFPGNIYIALVPSWAIYILPWLQGNIRNIALHWPLIRPRKVVYMYIYIKTSGSELRPRKVELASAHKKCDDYQEHFTHNNEACKNPYKTTLPHLYIH